MQRLSVLGCKASFGFGRSFNDQKLGCLAGSILPIIRKNAIESCYIKTRGVFRLGNVEKQICAVRSSRIWSVNNDNVDELFNGGGDEDDDDELCPVECVREFNTDEEFSRIMEKAKQTGALVVVDFYRTSCGSCKYIEQGFVKLCKGSGDEEAPVVFLKHNVLDEYDEQSEVAERLRIRSVPLFHFYKNGVLLEAFPTRDKERILSAILKYSGSSPQDA
ncbi:PREDICTED: thioredoxin-like 4, chloroplastic [Ipomoea nil]|uniref:thioredoxin-like 4, chloroplastic n=1 Tax=Ipomoea nil TaxID=35883 RepID=UPI000900A19A|nr:PREDICTED: thioredoxin-like 4, chloroplastic [Ipomoea nil]